MMAQLYDAISGAHFRLLTLHPSSIVHDPVSCDLTTYPLDRHPDYEAVSYCWGGQTCDRDIKCNSQLLQVTESAECLLKKLWHPDVPRLL